MKRDADILAFHRELVSIPSISGEEAAIQDFVIEKLKEHGAEPVRVGDSVLAVAGEGPVVLLNTHYDTVPPSPGWTLRPHQVEVEDGKVTGLGANDAKASLAAMCAAFVSAVGEGLPVTLALGIAAGEETDGHGTMEILAHLESDGRKPVAAVVGEPTGLNIAVAQKGLLIVEIQETGTACHAAHADRLGASNAIRLLARDLVSIERVDLGDEHPFLGHTTMEPTVIQGGTARNTVPCEASVIVDLRTTPAVSHEELVARLTAAVRGKLEVKSDRLRPYETDPEDPVVLAALAAAPDSKLFGSATMSDMAFMKGIPAIKVGPGQTERSHTPDEYVLESEILDGVRFYGELLRAYAAKAWAG